MQDCTQERRALNLTLTGKSRSGIVGPTLDWNDIGT